MPLPCARPADVPAAVPAEAALAVVPRGRAAEGAGRACWLPACLLARMHVGRQQPWSVAYFGRILLPEPGLQKATSWTPVALRPPVLLCASGAHAPPRHCPSQVRLKPKVKKLSCEAPLETAGRNYNTNVEPSRKVGEGPHGGGEQGGGGEGACVFRKCGRIGAAGEAGARRHTAAAGKAGDLHMAPHVRPTPAKRASPCERAVQCSAARPMTWTHACRVACSEVAACPHAAAALVARSP